MQIVVYIVINEKYVEFEAVQAKIKIKNKNEVRLTGLICGGKSGFYKFPRTEAKFN